MRTFFSAIPKVGTSKLIKSRSGNRDWLPTGTLKIGICSNRIRIASWTGGNPSFQSPSDANTTARKLLCSLRALARAACRLLFEPCSSVANGVTNTSKRSCSSSQAVGSSKRSIDRRRVTSAVEELSPKPTSCVSILNDWSPKTTTVGRSVGLNSSTDSGWLSRKRAKATMPIRKSSKSSTGVR